MTDIKLIKALIKGILTFIPGIVHLFKTNKSISVHSGSQAVFCYNLWLRILIHLYENGVNLNLAKIAEVGNGGSLGVGICALLTGSGKYYSFEVDDVYNIQQNLVLLDEIIILLKNKTNLEKDLNINIDVKKLDFPDWLITHLYLNSSFIEVLKKEIIGFKDGPGTILINIQNWSKLPSIGLDFVFSRAVLEHVKDPVSIYKSTLNHLKSNCLMLHDIEFHSHGVTSEMDGHFKIKNPQWKIIYGRREYFLNRWTLSEHESELINQKAELIHINKKYKLSSSGRNVLFGASILAKKSELYKN